MADFTPVALGIKPQQGMSLADMLNIANAAQQYQQTQQMNPLQLQKARMEIEQAQKMNPLAVREKTAQAGTAEFGLNDAQLKNMLGHTTNAIQGIQTLLADKDLSADKIKSHVQELVANSGGPESAVKQALIGLPEKGTQSELRAYLAKKLASAASQQVQLEKMYPSASAVNTGSAIVPVQMGNQMLTGVAPGTQTGLGIKQEIGPGQIMEPTGRTDPAGNPTAIVKDSSGNVLGEVIIPAGVPQGSRPQVGNVQSPANAPVRLPFETSETLKSARDIQLKAQQAATNVQSSQFNNNKIVELADKALVGANAEILSKLGGGYAVLPWSSDATQNRQILGHQMALETATLASGAGLGTDAARGLAEKMAGTTEWTPDAIKATARMNRALTTGTDMFSRGVNAAVASAGNNPLAARDFQSKWSSQEQLVPTLQFIDVLRNAKADPAGAKSMIDSLGGYGSDRYKQMLQRAGKLNELITKGQ